MSCMIIILNLLYVCKSPNQTSTAHKLGSQLMITVRHFTVIVSSLCKAVILLTLVPCVDYCRAPTVLVVATTPAAVCSWEAPGR